MRNKLYKIAQMASLLLALAFTFSCWMDGNAGCWGCTDPEEQREREREIEERKKDRERVESILNLLAPCVDGTVKIGDQVWQKCNLNVNPGTGKSVCYDNKPENCDKYGRLYDWETAMALPSGSCWSERCASQVSAKHRGLCPSGWHIPNDADWDNGTAHKKSILS